MAKRAQDNSDKVVEEESDDSGWETASDVDMADEEGEEGVREEWDIRRSLFDNHMSADMDANLDYMYRKFGFYFPDAEYLTDPEGLLQYLVSGCTLAILCDPYSPVNGKNQQFIPCDKPYSLNRLLAG